MVKQRRCVGVLRLLLFEGKEVRSALSKVARGRGDSGSYLVQEVESLSLEKLVDFSSSDASNTGRIGDISDQYTASVCGDLRGR